MINNRTQFFLILTLMLMAISCVQATKRTRVQFEVDTQSEEGDVGTLEIRGDSPSLSWNEGHVLADEDGDGIYTGEVVFDIPFDQTEIKFVKNGSVFELANEPNRTLVFAKDSVQLFRAVFDK